MKVEFCSFGVIVSVRAVEAILETGEKLEKWSKEPEPSVSSLQYIWLCYFGGRVVKVAVVRVFMSMFKQNRGKGLSECSTWFLSKAKVHNHLEMLKRVKSVYDKGDSEAKALALILFDCWRDFASEFAPVRYLIFTSTVSSHDLEVRLSLFAAGCFCEVADDFALVVLGMLLYDNLKFPELIPKTRLAVVGVFAKMGCSHAISNRSLQGSLSNSHSICF